MRLPTLDALGIIPDVGVNTIWTANVNEQAQLESRGYEQVADSGPFKLFANGPCRRIDLEASKAVRTEREEDDVEQLDFVDTEEPLADSDELILVQSEEEEEETLP